jgi:ribonuclease BN (tRNA processing enzyme)
LSRDADLLITECALKKGSSDENWPHLKPKDAARIADERNAKMLALLHFDANEYSALKARKQTEKEARKVFF